MNSVFRLFSRFGRRGALAGLAAAAGLAGCRHESVVPNPVVDYFPVVVGTYRTYAVADSTWASARPTVVNYQFRERVTEQFLDAAGQPAYRLVRSRRADASAAWVDDSVFIVQPLPRAVLLTRDNVRTVELVYPARANKGWNYKAFTASPDTITSLSRFYTASVASPYTTPAVAGSAAKTYDHTAATYDIFSANDNDGKLRKSGNQQVYAQGIGRVLRRRYSYYYFTTNPDGSNNIFDKVIQRGIARYEVLIETGTI